MRELGMILLSHTGEEHTVSAAGLDNELGNPLRLRAALESGVRVIAAHCATEGKAQDLDNPKGIATSCFSLWLRLMDHAPYEGLLFADISAITAFKRLTNLKALLDLTHLHHRLVYGSDYPVPCINVVVQTSQLVRAGLLTASQRVSLNQIYRLNPLLFDLVLKRCLQGPAGGRFPASLFMEHPLLKVSDWQRRAVLYPTVPDSPSSSTTFLIQKGVPPAENSEV